jgi:hypothetical protein
MTKVREISFNYKIMWRNTIEIIASKVESKFTLNKI